MNTLIKLPITLMLILSFSGCNMEADKEKKTPKNTIFIGIDVSGSFTRTKRFKDAMAFLGEYVWAHLENKGRLSKPKDLYIGGIGGNVKEDPQAFFPIHDFIGKSPKEITKKLLQEFGGQKDNLTDFNTYFLRVKSIVKQKNLVLAPISIIMITDGVPEIAGRSKQAVKQAYSRISIKPLEYLARNISIRILYAGPRVGNNWRTYVPTKRVRIWTVEPEVMYGWQEQKKRNGQKGLWNWIADNIDLRIQSRGL
ncbi:MAG: hypothetical protein HON90_08215 [Halobacteriovoraceae bacterium]|jgi:hypothetical protein|nr:hypothetical protein [Halobacteriovoraceae bacterium]